MGDSDPPHPLVAPQTARAAIRAGERFVIEADARATPLGLIAVGGLVAAILLAIPPIIRAARERQDVSEQGGRRQPLQRG